MRISLVQRLVFFVVSSFVVMLFVGVSSAEISPTNTIHICPTQNACSFNALTTAIQNASSGDTILLGSQQATVDIVARNITIDKDLTIRGHGPVATSLSPGSDPANELPLSVATRRLFHVVEGVNLTLENMTLWGGDTSMKIDSAAGGAILFEGGTLTLDTVSVHSNKTRIGDDRGCGGAIYFAGDRLFVSNSYFAHNFAYHGGAVCAVNGYLDPTSTATINDDTLFAQNWASMEGGALFILNAHTRIRDSSFTLNQTTLDGFGGGGAISVRSKFFSIVDSLLTNNSSNGENSHGGGIHFGNNSTGDLRLIAGTRFENNEAGLGGAVHLNYRPLLIVDSLLRGNSAREGGAIYAQNDSRAAQANQASGDLTLDRVSLIANTANDGGGMYISSSIQASVTNSTISANQSNQHGGGLYVTGALQMQNTTVVDNIANADNVFAGYGGGIYVVDSIFLPPTISNSIIADNQQIGPTFPPYGPDCFGQLDSGGYNIIETLGGRFVTPSGGGLTVLKKACVGLATTDLSGEDPGLEALAGSFPDFPLVHALRSDSVAINAGNPAGCVDNMGHPISDDQRRFFRSDRCDIGAFERNATPTNISLSANSVSPNATRAPILLVAALLTSVSMNRCRQRRITLSQLSRHST